MTSDILRGSKARERGIEARLNIDTARDRKADIAAAALHQIELCDLRDRRAACDPYAVTYLCAARPLGGYDHGA